MIASTGIFNLDYYREKGVMIGSSNQYHYSPRLLTLLRATVPYISTALQVDDLGETRKEPKFVLLVRAERSATEPLPELFQKEEESGL